jgi:hypothetical protein
MGGDDERREVVGYWGVCRGGVDRVDGSHYSSAGGLSGRGFVIWPSRECHTSPSSIASIYVRFSTQT